MNNSLFDFSNDWAISSSWGLSVVNKYVGWLGDINGSVFSAKSSLVNTML